MSESRVLGEAREQWPRRGRGRAWPGEQVRWLAASLVVCRVLWQPQMDITDITQSFLLSLSSIFSLPLHLAVPFHYVSSRLVSFGQASGEHLTARNCYLCLPVRAFVCVCVCVCES